MNYRSIHIAVVDDGVNSGCFDGISLKYDIEITKNLEIKERLSKSPYSNSHGTTCAAIIRKYYKKGILSSIKILDEKGLASKQKLIKAIEWCINNKVDIVHLSIGSVYYGDKKELKEIVDKANDSGLIIVAANKNEDVVTYPASFHNVIGVKSQRYRSLKEGEYIFKLKAIDGIEIISCGSHLLKNYKGKEYITQNCNSFAAPMITAVVAGIIEEFSSYSIGLIKKMLWERSNNYNNILFFEAYSNLNWIKNSLIFTTYSNELLVKKYIFHVKRVISIDKATKYGIFEEILKYLKYNKLVLNEIDTIIIESHIKIYGDSTQNIFSQIFSYISSYQKSIILINPKLNNLDIIRPLQGSIKAIYFNPLNQSDYMLSKQDQEKPLILICGEIWYNIINILSKINNEFIKDGYNPVVFTDDLRGIYFEYHCLPTQKEEFKYYDSQINRKINSFINIYSGDIGLIGLSSFNRKDEFIKKIRKILDIDIFILADGYDKNILHKGILDKDNTIILSDYIGYKDYSRAVFDKILEIYDAND